MLLLLIFVEVIVSPEMLVGDGRFVDKLAPLSERILCFYIDEVHLLRSKKKNQSRSCIEKTYSLYKELKLH